MDSVMEILNTHSDAIKELSEAVKKVSSSTGKAADGITELKKMILKLIDITEEMEKRLRTLETEARK